MSILDWLQTGWGYALALAGIISSYYAIKGSIKKLMGDIRKPLTDVEEKLEALDEKLDGTVHDIKEHDGITDKAMLAILKSDMLKTCEKYIKSGWATTEQKDILNKQFDSYLALGGNSFIPRLVEQVMALPLEKPNKEE